MSTLIGTIQAVGALQRNLSQQSIIINDFLRANRENIELIHSRLGGSQKGYDARMMNALNVAESSLRQSVAAMTQANEALQRVTLV